MNDIRRNRRQVGKIRLVVERLGLLIEFKGKRPILRVRAGLGKSPIRRSQNPKTYQNSVIHEAPHGIRKTPTMEKEKPFL